MDNVFISQSDCLRRCAWNDVYF